jgi:predicted nucleotidyltransferase
MQSRSTADIQLAIPKILEQVPYLKLLILFGSRARDDSSPDSDWDFAVLYDEELGSQHGKHRWDSFALWTVLQQVLQVPDTQLDVIDLSSCSDWLKYDIARDGKPLYERQPGEFKAFQQRYLKSPVEMKQLSRELRDRIRYKLKEWQV